MDTKYMDEYIKQLSLQNKLKYMELIKPEDDSRYGSGIPVERYAIERWDKVMREIGRDMGIDVDTIWDNKRKWP